LKLLVYTVDTKQIVQKTQKGNYGLSQKFGGKKTKLFCCCQVDADSSFKIIHRVQRRRV